MRELHHDGLTGQDRGLAPVLVRSLGGLHSRLHLGAGGLRDSGDDIVGGRVVQVDPLLGLGLDELAVDEQLGRGSRRGEATPSGQVQALKNGSMWVIVMVCI